MIEYTISEKALIGYFLERINLALVKEEDNTYVTTEDLIMSFDEEVKEIFDGLLKKYKIA